MNLIGKPNDSGW